VNAQKINNTKELKQKKQRKINTQ